MEISDDIKKRTILNQNSINYYNNELIISLDKSEKISKQSELYICKIKYENGKFGTGFLCKIPFPNENYYLPVLMTNEHVFNKDEIEKNKKKLIITFDNDKIEKTINITPERKIYISKDYDITIIEIFPEYDNIFHFLEVDIPNKYTNEFIYILQYPNGDKCSISYGKIISVKDFNIIYDCSTEQGSSGGPILILNNYKIIGIHRGIDNTSNYKIGSSFKKPIEEFNSIFLNKNNIIKKNYINCILCTYIIKNEEEFNLLYDYNEDLLGIDLDLNKLYKQGKKKKKFLEENINIYIDDQIIKFNFKYKTNKKKIKVKFIFKEILNDLSFIFFNCKYLESIDLSPFDAIHVTNMSYMFGGCESLKSIDFFSFNTSNVTNMSGMFCECESLEGINLTSFNTSKVINMNQIFFGCSAIKAIDLTSFNTINVTNMSKMFANCYSLKYLYINLINTINVEDMSQMFSKCSSLKSIDLSSFKTSKVINMDGMFEYCLSLEFLDASSFDTINVTDMKFMFMNCVAIKWINLSSFMTFNVTNMSQMFFGCCLLESLDLSLFNSYKARNTIEMMFFGCISLKNVKCMMDPNILYLVNKSKMIDYNLFK